LLWSRRYHRSMENERIVELEKQVLGERARGDYWKAQYEFLDIESNYTPGDEWRDKSNEAHCRVRAAKVACDTFGVKP